MTVLDTSLSMSEMQVRKTERKYVVLESLSLKKEEKIEEHQDGFVSMTAFLWRMRTIQPGDLNAFHV